MLRYTTLGKLTANHVEKGVHHIAIVVSAVAVAVAISTVGLGANP